MLRRGSYGTLFILLLHIAMAKPGNTAIYTRPGCPFCTKIKEVYRMKGYSFAEFTLSVNFTREQFYEQFGRGATFPQVLINGHKMGGCTETVKYLRENNLL